MQHKLLKLTLLALLIWAVVPSLNAQTAHVGDILCEGDLIVSPANYPSSGATAIGVVFYVDNTGRHGWAIALQDAGEFSWGRRGYDTQLPNYTTNRQAIYDLDGYQNTQIVREHHENHPAFYAVDFENGWYIPAIGQLNYLFANLIEVHESLDIVGGSALDVETLMFYQSRGAYWSSTEYNYQHAWFLSFFSGGFGNYSPHGWGKDNGALVRAVRNF